MIRIAKGETTEGLFWIVVFQYGLAEFRCQEIEGWYSEEFGMILEASCSFLTIQEIRKLIQEYS